jgi:hypothetical protein
MGGRKRFDEEAIRRLIKQGLGQGELADYLPWLSVRDVPSRGLSTRDKGWKTGRTHHFLSKGEYHYFLHQEWARCVIDIREQFPLLPREETLAIAQERQVEHPKHPPSGDDIVMTTDFRITALIKGKRVEQVRTFKLSKDLNSTRVLEKLEIERRYWERQRIDWGIVTERELSMTLVQNMDLIYDRHYFAENSTYSGDEIFAAATTLTRLVTEESLSLRRLALMCDDQLGFSEPGASLAIAYYLIANRFWKINMFLPIDPGKPLPLLGVNFDALRTRLATLRQGTDGSNA